MNVRKLVCFLAFFVMCSGASYTQCAMCKAVVESGDKGMAEGVNDGIVYLMIFPYILVAVLGYALYRYFKKSKS